MTDVTKPGILPARPQFSSGPCAKRPGWDPMKFHLDVLGRSHRAKLGKARLKLAIDLTRKVLGVPDGYRIGIVPASDTGAVEMAMWSMLGTRPVTTIAWESFGEGWVTDVAKQLKLNPTVVKAPYGELPDLKAVDFASDVIFTWNGTTSGVRAPNGDWIPADREGLTFADATFDLIITQDVMEHVLDPAAALREIARVLKPGGAHIFTVPLVNKCSPTSRRAERQPDGSILHLAEPSFHGNPIDSRGSLVTVDWGYDIIEFIREESGLSTHMITIDEIERGIRAEFIEVLVSVRR